MNYKDIRDIRSRSSLPYNDICITRNNKLGFIPHPELGNMKLRNDISPIKTPRANLGKGKDSKSYIEIKKKRERLYNHNKSNSSDKDLTQKNSHHRLMGSGNFHPRFINTYLKTTKKFILQKNEGSQKTLQKSNTTINQNDTVKVYLKRIFEYYCQYGERMNVNSLKSNKFQKLAIDGCILDNKLTKTKLEIIFSSENKSNKNKSQMDFETFLNSLIKIADIKFSNNKNDSSIKQSNNLQMLLKNHLWPLHEKIFGTPAILNQVAKNISFDKDASKNSILDGGKQVTNDENSTIQMPVGWDILTQMGTNMKKDDIPHITTDLSVSDYKFTRTRRSLTPDASANSSNSGGRNTFNLINSLVDVDHLLITSELENILKTIAPVMYEIYRVYFPWEISLSNDESYLRENSAKGYFAFLREFDLCPSLINKTAAFHIYQSETTTMPNYGSDLNKYYMNIIKNIEVSSLGRINNKGIIGKFFTFIRFLKVICKIGDLAFGSLQTANGSSLEKRNFNKNLTEIEKICLLLERIELSDGFTLLEKKTNKTHTSRTSYIIPNEILNTIKQSINVKMNEENFVVYDMDNLNDAKNAELMQQNNRKTKLKKSVLGNFKDLFEHTNQIIEKYGNQLNAIFKYYCSFGDPLNTTQMKINKFCKFLREAGLLKINSCNSSILLSSSVLNVTMSQNFGIKLTDVDVIFFKLAGLTNISNIQSNSSDIFNITRSSLNLNQSQSSLISLSNNSPTSFTKKGSVVNANAKIDFNGFVNSIELISLLILNDKNEIEGIDYIMSNNVLPLVEKFAGKFNEQHQKIFTEKKENSDFVKALSCLNKVIAPVFKYYQKNGLLNFDSFLKFCSDFGVFPDIVSKSKLSMFFKSTINNEFTHHDLTENETIDLNLFADILALCAFEIPYRCPEPKSVEKIILFMEKLNQSVGPNKIIKEYGQTRLPNGDNIDFINIFKNNFPIYFNLPENKKVGFFDILNEEEEYI